MTSLTGAERSDNCGFWTPRFISGTVVFGILLSEPKLCTEFEVADFNSSRNK